MKPEGKFAVVTGHGSGIGAALSAALTRRGWEIQGFSLENGFDLTEKEAFRKAVLAAKGATLFVNCAHSGFLQTEILYQIANAWKRSPEGRTILNIGSVVGDGTWNYLHPYAIHKSALDKAVAQVQATLPELRTLLIRPGLVDTRMGAGHSGPKLSVASVVEAALWMLDRPESVHVQSLTLVPRGHGRRDASFPERTRYNGDETILEG